MIDTSFTVNTAQFEAAMMRLREGVRRGFVDAQYGLLPVQGRLLAERCQTFTPPQNVGQGKAAVVRDITNIFRPLSHTTFTNKRLRKVVRTDDRPGWDIAATFFGGSHNLNNTKAMGFSKDFHKRNRNKRGRGFKVKYGNIGFVTLGPEARQVRRYIAEKKKMVGWARAGWGAAIWGLGGNLGPNWIARHGARGQLVNGTASPDPFIQVINDSSWAKQAKEGNRILRNAVAARSRDMESYFFRMMKVAQKKAEAA